MTPRSLAAWILGFIAATTWPLAAQTLTGVTALPNGGNPPDEFSGVLANPSYERESAVAVKSHASLRRGFSAAC